MGEERKGREVRVGRLGGDVDHGERRGRLGGAGAGELFVDVSEIYLILLYAVREMAAGGEIQFVDDEFGVLAAIAEEVQFVVGGGRTVAVEQEFVPGPAVQRMPDPQGGTGEDLGVEGFVFIDAGLDAAFPSVGELRDLHRSPRSEPVDGRGGLRP